MNDRMVPRAKINEIDLVRAFAIIAVVLIHTTASATVELMRGSVSHFFFFGLNKLSHFAVPVFIFISGIVLFYRYYDGWNGKQAIQFYRKRIFSVVIPYLLFSVFYYVYNQWLFNESIQLDWNHFVTLLKWGTSSYHLYYMIIIIQFYLLFPVVMTLAKKWQWFAKNMIVIGILLQALFYTYHRWISSVDHVPSLALTYMSVFMLGGFIGIYYEAFRSWLNRNVWWILPCAILVGVAFSGLFLLDQNGYRLELVLFEIGLHLYSMLVGISLLWIGSLFMDRVPRLASPLQSIGKTSYGIYLIHPALLSLYVLYVTKPTSSLAYDVFTLISFLAVFLGSWILSFGYGFARGKLKQRKKFALSE